MIRDISALQSILGGQHGGLDTLLQKALSVGNTYPVGGTPGDASPGLVESLQATVNSLTYSMEDLVIRRMFPRTQAQSTYELASRLLSRGTYGSRATAENALPVLSESTWDRVALSLKIYAERRAVGTIAQHTPALQLIDPVNAEAENMMIELMKTIEAEYLYGDSSVDSLEMDGLYRQIWDNSPAEHIVDMNGATLTRATLNEYSRLLRDKEKFGRLTDVLTSTRAIEQLAEVPYTEGQPYFHPGSGPFINGAHGPGMVNSFNSVFGRINYNYSIFLDEGNGGPTTPSLASIGDTPPTAPSAVAVTDAAVTVPAYLPLGQKTTSNFDGTGTYLYWVESIANEGKSAALVSDSGTPATITDGNQATVTITGGTGKYFRVYRSATNDISTARYIGRVPRTGASTVFVDRNSVIPGTSIAIGYEKNPMVIQVKELIQGLKLSLGRLATVDEFCMLFVEAIWLQAPAKVVLFTNVAQ